MVRQSELNSTNQMLSFFLNRHSLRTQLLIFFLLAGLIPFSIVGITAYYTSETALRNQIIAQLDGIRETKKRQIDQYFVERKGDMEVLTETALSFWQQSANSLGAIQAQKRNQVKNYYNRLLKLGELSNLNTRFIQGIKEFSSAIATGVYSAEYKAVLTNHDKGLKSLRDNLAVANILLIDANGNIVYSTNESVDLGQNVTVGSLKNSPLGKVFAKAGKETAIGDFALYEPLKDFASFVAVPLNDETGSYLGVVAFQISKKEINNIMQDRSGLTATAESFLIAKDSDGKYTYRSDRVVKQGNIGEERKGESGFIEDALSGNTGRLFKLGNKGKYELTLYEPVKIQGLNWAIITTVSVEEIVSPKSAGATEDYYSQYVKAYGYYDLMLVATDGQVFYTVHKEADYGTNVINGQYKNYGLGRVVKKASYYSGFAFEDFDKYAPSDNKVSAFIAQPVVDNGEVIFTLALQLSPTGINNIMAERTGLGKTGESYLVGSDNLMRSDSIQDTAHKLQASFENPETGSIKTIAVEEGLAGKSGSKSFTGYTGDQIIASYAPVRVFGTVNWVLIAKMNDTEAFAPVYDFAKTMGILGVGVLIVLILFALFVVGFISQGVTTTNVTNNRARRAQRLYDDESSGLNETGSFTDTQTSQSQKEAEEILAKSVVQLVKAVVRVVESTKTR